MDAFCASVEQRDNPEPARESSCSQRFGGRGVAVAASYEARKFGVRSATPSVSRPTSFGACGTTRRRRTAAGHVLTCQGMGATAPSWMPFLRSDRRRQRIEAPPPARAQRPETHRNRPRLAARMVQRVVHSGGHKRRSGF
ncbi:hypothetical protein [Bradyrhizobium sp. GM2.2]|uniref:Y-family DNA polymerase n=1 Tax=Bradyrhizobium sp. GM2.2 TaxID=3156358 RepID=UPI003395B71D